MNTHRIVRTFPTQEVIFPGKLVNASGWLNRQLLEDQGYIERLPDETAAEPGVEVPAVETPVVETAVVETPAPAGEPPGEAVGQSEVAVEPEAVATQQPEAETSTAAQPAPRRRRSQQR